MKSSGRRGLIGGLWWALVFCLVFPTVLAAQGSPSAGLGVQGALAEYSVKAGQVLEHKMVVTLGPAAPAPVDIVVEARGLGQALDGAALALSPAEDTNPLSAREFITDIDRPSFRLAPGAAQEVIATITVPADAAPGTRYADIYISTLPSGSGPVGMVLAAHVPVILKLAGGQPSPTGSITELRVGKVLPGQPIEITTTVLNTGNLHYKVRNRVTLTDAAGQVIADGEAPFLGSSIVPTFARQLKASFNFNDRPRGLPAGTYYAESTATLPDGTLVDTKKVSFELAVPYQPFPGIDEDSLVITVFNDEEPGVIDARAKADVELAFRDTGKVTGVVVIGKFKQEPEGPTAFAAAKAEGGTGQSGVKFVGIGVQGFSKGTARVTVYYREAEIRGLDPNSLFLAYRDGETWTKLENLDVLTGAQTVRGDVAVGLLNRNLVIGLGGDAIGGATTAAGSPLDWLADNLVLVGVAAGAAVLVPTVLLLANRRQGIV